MVSVAAVIKAVKEFLDAQDKLDADERALTREKEKVSSAEVTIEKAAGQVAKDQADLTAKRKALEALLNPPVPSGTPVPLSHSPVPPQSLIASNMK